MDNQLQVTDKEMDYINKKMERVKKVALRARKEIFSIFTDREISLVKDVWYCSDFHPDMSFQDMLYKALEAIHEDDFNAKWKVNRKSMLHKIRELTDFQAFTLIHV